MLSGAVLKKLRTYLKSNVDHERFVGWLKFLNLKQINYISIIQNQIIKPWLDNFMSYLGNIYTSLSLQITQDYANIQL